jgi:hypothetical protein
VPVEIFKLRNNASGSFCDFYMVDSTHAHFLLFKVAPQNEGKFWIARNDFKGCFSVLVKAGITRMSGTVLTDTVQYPLTGKADEWRTDSVEIAGEKLSKLALFWRRIGFVPYQAMLNRNPGYMLLVAPELTLEIKDQFARASLGNPYQLLCRSIYDKDLEEQLKSESSARK